MKKKYRCANAVNEIVAWNKQKGNGRILELEDVVNGENHIAMVIRGRKNANKMVRITVKATGAVMFDIKSSITKEIVGLSFKQRVLSNKKWLRIECGHKEVKALLQELDEKLKYEKTK